MNSDLTAAGGDSGLGRRFVVDASVVVRMR
jgi:hypothetical protein